MAHSMFAEHSETLDLGLCSRHRSNGWEGTRGLQAIVLHRDIRLDGLPKSA
jgi:hypothetical protein